MAIKTRIEPLAEFLQVAVNESLSPAAQSKAIATFAAGELGKAQDKNRGVLGRVPPHHTFVDGRAESPLDQVRPEGGVIVFEFELISDVLQWIASELRANSPVVSGQYREGHTVFADGSEIDVGGAIPKAEEYSFTNTVPYSRRLEIGKTKSGRSFVIQVSPRIYERVASAARARFGNICKIEYTFRGIVGGYQVNPRKARRGGAHNKSDMRYPTIVVRDLTR